MEKNFLFKQTAKGRDLLKVLKATEEFKRKYSKKSSEDLELVGIYDNRFVRRILKQSLKS